MVDLVVVVGQCVDEVLPGEAAEPPVRTKFGEGEVRCLAQ